MNFGLFIAAADSGSPAKGVAQLVEASRVSPSRPLFGEKRGSIQENLLTLDKDTFAVTESQHRKVKVSQWGSEEGWRGSGKSIFGQGQDFGAGGRVRGARIGGLWGVGPVQKGSGETKEGSGEGIRRFRPETKVCFWQKQFVPPNSLSQGGQGGVGG